MFLTFERINCRNITLETTVTVSVKSWFRISCLKNEMINNVDKWSVRLKQRLHFFQDYIISWIMGTYFTQKQKNDDCPLSLMTVATSVAVAVESQFRIRWLKKEMKNNVDKWSVILIKWIYVDWNNKNIWIVETTLSPKQTIDKIKKVNRMYVTS